MSSDEVADILTENDGLRIDTPDGLLIGQAHFDEAAYLRLNPDVADSVRRGEYASGYQHYVLYGVREGRSAPGASHEPRNRLLLPTVAAQPTVVAEKTGFNIEEVIVCPSGGIFVVGWVDDTISPLAALRLGTAHWRVVLDRTSIVRVRRGDVETCLGRTIAHRFGFIGFVHVDHAVEIGGNVMVHAWLDSMTEFTAQVPLRAVSEIDLRNILLTRLAQADFLGNPTVERIACLDGGLGLQIVAFNRAITRRLVANPYVERFGAVPARCRGSIVVAIYGLPDYLWVQNALFAGLPGIEDYEFIYVSNSPELGETLLREARIGSLIYGTAQTVMVLPGNAGFGAANNVAVSAAMSDRILNVNPDVFPRHSDWAMRHTAIVEAGGDASRLFGVPLYYDDGSLMHGGMHFEVDEALSMVDGQLNRRRMLRVEHYGKGAPPEGTVFMRERPVPAVTGAFISTDRSWFERLGGFSEDYVFGHYEDADFCLKSLEQGTPAWLRDVRMWHFEGKGSTRQPPHEGGSVVNRWLFSRRWDSTLADGLLGPTPTHPLLAMPESSAP